MMSQASLPTSKAAAWSLVFGILSMTCIWLLGSIPAIILGTKALKETSGAAPEKSGRGLAISGIVTGAVGSLSGLFLWGIVASIAMPAYNGVQERATQVVALSEIRIILIANETYQLSEGAYAESLDQLFPDYVNTIESLTMIDASSGAEIPYLYRPEGYGTDDPATSPVILSPIELGSRRFVGYADGSSAELSAPFDEKLLRLFEE